MKWSNPADNFWNVVTHLTAIFLQLVIGLQILGIRQQSLSNHIFRELKLKEIARYINGLVVFLRQIHQF